MNGCPAIHYRYHTGMKPVGSKTRGWLIFSGIVILILALPLLRIRVWWMLRHLAIPVALIGLCLLALARFVPRKKKEDPDE